LDRLFLAISSTIDAIGHTNQAIISYSHQRAKEAKPSLGQLECRFGKSDKRAAAIRNATSDAA
jgi:hypothetical protein